MAVVRTHYEQLTSRFNWGIILLENELHENEEKKWMLAVCTTLSKNEVYFHWKLSLTPYFIRRWSYTLANNRLYPIKRERGYLSRSFSYVAEMGR